MLFVRNLRRSRFGRLLIASRDNDSSLQSAGVSIIKTRLQAFAISGGIAGFGGGLLGFQLRTVTATGFDAKASFELFIYVVLGGVSSIAGAMIGVAYLGSQTYFTTAARPWLHHQHPADPDPLLRARRPARGLQRLRDSVLRIVAQRQNSWSRPCSAARTPRRWPAG